jgi:hypothetical protein
LKNIREAAAVRDMRPPVERSAWASDARMRAPDQTETRTLEDERDDDPYDARTSRTGEDMRPPAEPTHTTQEERAAYPVLNEIQTAMFVVAYKITGNMDESLKRAGANTRYREHARQLIQERNLRKQA